jgi:hypothetical protein
MSDMNTVPARNVDQLLKEVTLTRNELIIYEFGRLFIQQLLQFQENKIDIGNIRESIKSFLKSPKCLELIILASIIAFRKVPFIPKIIK